MGLMVVVMSAWLGRCSQLVPSPARTIVHVFLALCGRYRDKDFRAFGALGAISGHPFVHRL